MLESVESVQTWCVTWIYEFTSSHEISQYFFPETVICHHVSVIKIGIVIDIGTAQETWNTCTSNVATESASSHSDQYPVQCAFSSRVNILQNHLCTSAISLSYPASVTSHQCLANWRDLSSSCSSLSISHFSTPSIDMHRRPANERKSG